MNDDVRKQLTRLLLDAGVYTYDPVADDILAAFDVKPKGSLSPYELGAIVQELNLGIDGWQYPRFREEIGARLLKALRYAGWKVVRDE